MEEKWKFDLFQIWNSERHIVKLLGSFQWPRLTHGLQRGEIIMLLPFLPASQKFISFNLTHWILCLPGLWRFNNLHVQLALSRTPPLLAGLILATALPLYTQRVCESDTNSNIWHGSTHVVCRRQTPTAMQSAKIIQCFPLDPTWCFLASLGTSLLAHQPRPKKLLRCLFCWVQVSFWSPRLFYLCFQKD